MTTPDSQTLAADELVALARDYGEGRNGKEANLGTALYYAEEAARRDSADGYHEISRIVGSACIASDDLTFKHEYATYLIGCCDPETLSRHKRGDTAYNVATVCAYMAEFLENHDSHDAQDLYAEQAKRLYTLALAIHILAPNEANNLAAAASKDGLDRLENTPQPNNDVARSHLTRTNKPASAYTLQ